MGKPRPKVISGEDADKLYWYMRAGLAPGESDPDINEAIRRKTGICQAAWDAVKAKQSLVHVDDPAKEFLTNVRGMMEEFRQQKLAERRAKARKANNGWIR